MDAIKLTLVGSVIINYGLYFGCNSQVQDLEKFHIDVSNNSDGSSAQQCAHDPGRLNPSETRVYACPCGIYGRYVRIRYPPDVRKFLTLCEVQVQAGGICPEPEKMENAIKSVPPQYEVGAKISYTCDQCYTGGGTSTCQCNTQWSPVEKCYLECCNDPGSIENGQMEGTDPFTCISTVKYTCNQGFWLLGAEVLRCGINGQWNHAKPSCIEKNLECGEPPKIPNSVRFGSVTEVTYQCDECYTGGGSATCRDGEWSHTGSCDTIPCDNIPDVPKGKTSPCEGSVACDTKVTYTCNEGFTLEGDSVLQCGTGGKLQGEVPVCKDSGSPVSGNEKDNGRETDKKHGDLALGLTAIGCALGGILVALAAVYFCRRKGMDPCARAALTKGPNQANQDYEQPTVTAETAVTATNNTQSWTIPTLQDIKIKFRTDDINHF